MLLKQEQLLLGKENICLLKDFQGSMFILACKIITVFYPSKWY